MSKSKINKKGFTLIEATISIFILLVGILAVAEFFPFSLRIIGDSQDTTVAAELALAKIENLETLNYDAISTGTIEAKHRLSNDETNYLYNYQRQTVVQTVDSNFNLSAQDVGLKKITVTVFWNSSVRSKEKSITLTSLAADY